MLGLSRLLVRKITQSWGIIDSCSLFSWNRCLRSFLSRSRWVHYLRFLEYLKVDKCWQWRCATSLRLHNTYFCSVWLFNLRCIVLKLTLRWLLNLLVVVNRWLELGWVLTHVCRWLLRLINILEFSCFVENTGFRDWTHLQHFVFKMNFLRQIHFSCLARLSWFIWLFFSCNCVSGWWIWYAALEIENVSLNTIEGVIITNIMTSCVGLRLSCLTCFLVNLYFLRTHWRYLGFRNIIRSAS